MWKSWKRRALAENKTDYSKYRFSWQEYLLCFFKAFFATGWRFRQYGRFYTDATKRTEFKKERKDSLCNLRILS